MGVIGQVIAAIFGGGGHALRETAEVFRENAEAGAQRATQLRMGALEQFAAEFVPPQRGGFDRLMDAVNRLPRPALAMGTLGLFVAAMVDPVWFAARMQGIALVPEPLWWLLGVIVSFYFGARHQRKTQDFQRDIALTLAQTPGVMANIAALHDLRADSPDAAAATSEVNPALEDWRKARAA